MKKLQLMFVCIALSSFTNFSQAQTSIPKNQIEKEDEEDGDGETRGMQTACGGTELWSLKVLTDPAATTVNYTPVASTVATLVALTTPTPSSSMSRTAPVETTTYIITCNITIKKVETDNDYHLVLSDGTHTLIGEIPDPNCTAALTSAHKNQFAAAKAFIDAHIASGNVMNVSMAQVTITGVGFVDPPHGQTGAAPNNLELHPILDIHFASANVPPTAVFTASSTTACVGQTITLLDNSTNGPTSWNWTLTGGNPTSSTSQNPSVIYNTAGTYTVKLVSTNSAGASSPVSHTIIVNANPPTPTINANGNLLTSNVPSKDQWYLNGALIPGDTIPTDTATQSGSYKVVVTNVYGCTSSSTPINISTTDITSIINNDVLTIFPNPTNGNVTLNFIGKSNQVTVEVYNDVGQMIYTENNNCPGDFNKTIDMNSFKKGIYLFRIIANGNIHTRKVLLVQ